MVAAAERVDRALRGEREAWYGLTVLVIGLGRSGCAAARWALARGAKLVASDRRGQPELGGEVAALAGAGAELQLGEQDRLDPTRAQLIVVSPGVPLTLPALSAARALSIPIHSELDLAAHSIGGRAIGITGSNGKSTTTALVATMLGAAGFDGVACGNFGTPLCDAVDADHPARFYAIELSSFQLETTERLTCSAAIVLNLQPDHLDRHGSLEAYRQAKFRIAGLRAPGAPLVICSDDPELAPLAREAAAPVWEVSLRQPVTAGGMLRGERLELIADSQTEFLATTAELPIPGRHNQLNILAAAAACRAVGATTAQLREAVLRFRALPHRLQEVAQVNGVRFVDDSKATNVGSALEAIASFGGAKLWVLLGGRDKHSDFLPLVGALDAVGATALTFGEAGGLIAAVLEGAGARSVVRCETLEQALRSGFEQATPGDVILLSPACASFDAYSGYAARGDHFASMARSLAERRR